MMVGDLVSVYKIIDIFDHAASIAMCSQSYIQDQTWFEYIRPRMFISGRASSSSGDSCSIPSSEQPKNIVKYNILQVVIA